MIKLDRALDLMKKATSKSVGLYAFSNLIGCDGARICFNGRSLMVLNGKVVSKTTTTDTFLRDVDFAIYKLDPLDIINYRQQFKVRSLSHRNVGSRLNYYANQSKLSEPDPLSSNIPCQLESIAPEQEIIMYGSLCGGLDSASVACLVYCMSSFIYKHAKNLHAGYLTKYDCSSDDLNPIGSLSKRDLCRFLSYIKNKILTEDKEVLD
uniref:Uncharacterized protein n=1 Tax=Tetranychus urticae TaxID=32264 RepID=T1KF68_TETUR